MEFLKNAFVYILTLFIIFAYVILSYYLKIKGVLQEKDFINNTTIFVGWIVALLIAWIHLQKTRQDNKLAKKDEIKKTLEINAFREITKAVTDFSSVLSSVGVSYLFLPSELKLHVENPSIFKFDKMGIYEKLNKQITDIHGGNLNFTLVIESNEIAVIEVDHYRKYIQFQVDDTIEMIRDFLDYFSKAGRSNLTPAETFSVFEKRCHEVSDKLMCIQCYLFDYRIELMNTILAEIFDKRVPERKPLDPKRKTLREVAIKEKVEEESRERANRVLKKQSDRIVNH